MQKGNQNNLHVQSSQDRIERLEEIGWQWPGVDNDAAFKKHCRELTSFKEEFGHCNVPRSYSDNPPIGTLV